NAGQVAGAMLASFAALVGRQIQVADETGKVAQKLGVTTEFISEMGYAAVRAGGDTKSLEAGLFGLSEHAARASEGVKKPSAAFRSLGIDVHDAAGRLKGVDQLLPELADKFARMEDGPRKAALAVAIFGDTGKNLITVLDKGGDGLAALREEAVNLGQ